MSIYTNTDGKIGILTLDRPKRSHAYDQEHLMAIEQGVRTLAQESRVILIQSTGERAFCAGADLDELQGRRSEDALDLLSHHVFEQIARCPIPTIAVVQGEAVAGGFELALACDFRVLHHRAVMWLPETAMGLIPAAGGTTRLTALVGASVAKAIILAGRRLEAPRALALGLAIEVCEEPRGAAMALAKEISEREPVALRLAKGLIDSRIEPRSLEQELLAEAVLYGRRTPRERG
ncbi:MAG: enoyl-CoA hydratase/isomerase family protein [Candidatus Competibacterales bacterium]